MADEFDVVVVGGGPAGVSAAMWAARYRRKVLLVDGCEQRNRFTERSHGYFGLDGASPDELLKRGYEDLDRYPNAEVRRPLQATSAAKHGELFTVTLGGGAGDGSRVTTHRLILATGVRDVMPQIENFAEHYGASVFTCPSCDGFEARGKKAVVFGYSDFVANYAIGLLDWAESVTVVTNGQAFEGGQRCREALEHHGIALVEDEVARLVGRRGEMSAAVLRDGREVECAVAFIDIGQEHRADLFRQLGCKLLPEGCVVVDDDRQTTVAGVYAAGDVTPGPHLIQVAAAEGATAGIAAAQSMRGERAAPGAPTPAPDAAVELHG